MKYSNLILSTLLLVKGTHSLSFQEILQQFVGCFQDVVSDRDLAFESSGASAEACIKACSDRYFMYAGLQNGRQCFCGSSYGKHGKGVCNVKCSGRETETCGGSLANSIYRTNIKVPGPSKSLDLIKSSSDTLSLKWTGPDAPETFMVGYVVEVNIIKNYNSSNVWLTPKKVELPVTTTSTDIVGLLPAALYNVSLTASSEDGQGPPISKQFWTKIAAPATPSVPQLIQHGHAGEDDGELHIKFDPMTSNPNGPITAYRIVVIDETDPVFFDEEELYNWTKADELGLKYWIAAEVEPDYFQSHSEFVVGDGRYYGGYYNYGPLRTGNDYHVTIGAVSSFHNVSKVTYAKVSHDQHSKENIVVFQFHSHDHDHGDHDHDHRDKNRNAYEVVHDHSEPDAAPDTLAVILSVAIVVGVIILVGALVFYMYLRRTYTRGSRADVQELTTHVPIDVEANGYVHDGFESDVTSSGMEAVRKKVWQVPRNFLELSHEVVGRGKFGSVIKGTVNKRGVLEAAHIHATPDKTHEDTETRRMAHDIDLVLQCGVHSNLIQLIGICQDQGNLFIVMEEGGMNLKQFLLDSRALLTCPEYAQKSNRFSTAREETIMDFMLGVARGMSHLEKLKIFHQRLCARNISVLNNIAKISGIGISEVRRQDIDLNRWVAPETTRSNRFISKCDTWSYGVVMWEMVSLGGTPYYSIRSHEVIPRVQQGLRLPQSNYVTDDLYQIMLHCWQLDTDERPNFAQIETYLMDMIHQGTLNLNFTLTPGFQYEQFSQEQEIRPQGSQF